MRMLLADDHLLLIEMIATYLCQDDTVTVDKAATLPAAMQLLNSGHEYDLVVLDYQMPGMNGLLGLKQVLAAENVKHVALMSGQIPASEAREAFRLGAVGVIAKSVSANYFVQTLKYLAMGGKHMPDEFAEGADAAQNPFFEQLSRRETEILREIATGKTNKSIAYELGIRETTVKQFVTLINKKLNVQNRTQAALLARDHGLL
ncbi:response regulator transcription factor [Thalassovita mediterranea]|uniref:Protease production enhancer protein n=1 Tax=Thalassovita mediterranea TaxID=340021 RepID=A0A0P1H2E5_9RHOB|nr:response regulator transcription factor [Thalassovita mediterranea]CUH84325.1 Protease production enhancer protein [Thalassovita mediterranea]SIS31864.1 two component transcriptional regulator, LuxR family [Thalassovita mediterranea]